MRVAAEGSEGREGVRCVRHGAAGSDGRSRARLLRDGLGRGVARGTGGARIGLGLGGRCIGAGPGPTSTGRWPAWSGYVPGLRFRRRSRLRDRTPRACVDAPARFRVRPGTERRGRRPRFSAQVARRDRRKHLVVSPRRVRLSAHLAATADPEVADQIRRRLEARPPAAQGGRDRAGRGERHRRRTRFGLRRPLRSARASGRRPSTAASRDRFFAGRDSRFDAGRRGAAAAALEQRSGTGSAAVGSDRPGVAARIRRNRASMDPGRVPKSLRRSTVRRR